MIMPKIFNCILNQFTSYKSPEKFESNNRQLISCFKTSLMNKISYKIAFSLNQLQSFIKSRSFLKSQQNLRELFQKQGVDDTHGYSHAIKVMNHATNAIRSLLTSQETQSALQIQPNENLIIPIRKEADKQKNQNIDIKYVRDVIFAALLHDADDRKYFPSNKNYENAQKILLEFYKNREFTLHKQNNYEVGKDKQDDIYTKEEVLSRIQFVKYMISKVSYSKNGDNIDYGQPEIFLYPRYADRIEAIGAKGVIRSFQYNMAKGQNIYLQSTKIPISYQQLIMISQGRDAMYMKNQSKSDSFIDHIFDKLIHLRIPEEITNIYLRECYKNGKQQIATFVLKCAQTNYRNTVQQIKKLEKQICDNN